MIAGAMIAGAACVFFGFWAAVVLAAHFETRGERMAATSEAKWQEARARRADELGMAQHNVAMLQIAVEENRLIDKVLKNDRLERGDNR